MNTQVTAIGLSDQIRRRAVRDYIEPALKAHRNTITIRIKDLMRTLESEEGFPPNHPAQFCTALQKRSFLKEYGLEVERVEGPPSGRSTTVVLHLRVLRDARKGNGAATPNAIVDDDDYVPAQPNETPRQWAERVVGNLHGLLKNELAEYGGAEGFIRWIRSEDEP